MAALLSGCDLLWTNGRPPWEKTTYDLGTMDIEVGSYGYGIPRTEFVHIYKDGKNGQPYYYYNGVKEYMHESGGRLVRERTVPGRTD